MEQNEELEKVEEIIKDSPINNPDLTFCENTTYLELLLANAKDEEEAQAIKETINDYLDITEEEQEERESDE